MKRRTYGLLIAAVIVARVLFSCGGSIAYAEEAMSSVSGDDVNEHGSTSENLVPLTITCEIEKVSEGRADVKVEVRSDSFRIERVQAENNDVGIWRNIYCQTPDGHDSGPDEVSLEYELTANGVYTFSAYDMAGDISSCEIEVKSIPQHDIDRYRNDALRNREDSTVVWSGDHDREQVPVYYGTALLGGSSTESYDTHSYSAEGYTVTTKGEGDSEEPTLEKYKNWSMLKPKDALTDLRAWFEPYAADGSPLTQPLENILDLSDYKADLFSNVKGNGLGDVLGEAVVPEITSEGRQSSGDGDIHESGSINKAQLVCGVIAVLILVISMAAITAWNLRT